MDYKLLFLDIDGTILMPDHTYAFSTKEAIRQVKDQGIEVFIATGRPLHEIKELAEELTIESFIGYNGAFAVYQDEILVNEPIDRKQVEAFLHIAKHHGHEMVLYSNGKNYFTSLDHPTVQQFKEIFQMTSNELFSEDVLDDILGITVMNVTAEESSLYQLDETIRLSQVNVDGARNAYDILRTRVNKGEAVKKVLHRLQIKKEQAIAFGDGMNDVEMVQAVGEGFAMGNSNPESFQYAKHKTTDVTDSGIFHGLKMLGLVK